MKKHKNIFKTKKNIINCFHNLIHNDIKINLESKSKNNQEKIRNQENDTK